MATTATTAPAPPAPPPATGGRCASCVLDCGWVLDEDTPMWPGICSLRRRATKTPETTRFPGCRSKQGFELNGGHGTHIDAPAHFVGGGRTVDELRPEELVGVPLAVVDAEAACARDADHAVTEAELQADEERHGPILPGSLVCLRTGWAQRMASGREQIAKQRGAAEWKDVGPIFTAYHNIGEADDIHPDYKFPRMHFPGLAPAAAAWLVRDRGAVGVGVDTMSPDPGASEGNAVHHAILGADRYILENLNLEGLPARGATAMVAPVKLRGAPEAPARVFALVPPQPPAETLDSESALRACKRSRGA